MANEKEAKQVNDDGLVELYIPEDPYSQKKSRTLRLALNGREMRLERGKTHRVPPEFKALYDRKTAARRAANAYARKQLAENNKPK